jgi:hypothetical protein
MANNDIPPSVTTAVLLSKAVPVTAYETQKALHTVYIFIIT